MPRVSIPLADIKPHYTVVVVGSGYGGAIAASRMARAGQSVCLLERGKEWRPGEYPDTEREAMQEMQADTPAAHVGSRLGLYDFRFNDDLNVFVGCGLGGTSLVNANVSLKAEPRVFDDPRWPAPVRDDGLLEAGYGQACEMLKPVPYPEGSDGFPPLPKLEALKRSAEALGGKFSRPPINVTFRAGVNHVGVEQGACALVGDCVSGCNYGAKNTTLMNYLPDARNFGAEIFTQAEVRFVEHRDGRWLVHYQPLGTGREKFDAPTLVVSADLVILGAGALGSTEILLRSKENGLPLSDRIGRHLTGNGDVLAFGYNCDMPINGIGFGLRKPGDMAPVGPCISGLVDLREQPELSDGMVIEEGSIPGAVADLLPAGFAAAAIIAGQHRGGDLGALIRTKERELESLVRGAYHGAMQNTQIYLVMTHDDGNGEMALEDDRLRIRWPGVASQPIFDKVAETLTAATAPLGGSFVRNPMSSDLFKKHLITVHPLGGCVMADGAEGGVVNHKGQAFAGSSGSAVHEGLYVADGSIVPRPLGVNPLLTISALAERCCALIAADRGWSIDYALPSKPRQTAEHLTPGIQFTETMRGWFALRADDYEQGAARGEAEGSPFEFTLTIASDNLDEMLTNPAHEARMVGTATAPALSPTPLTATDGVFNLFVDDPDEVGVRLMKYRMKLTADDGRHWFFTGFKRVHHDRGLDMWADTTTLFITLHDGGDDSAPVLGRGILRILPEDFQKQMTTMQVTNTDSVEERLKGVARFGQFFAGVLYDTYGGVFARPTAFDPSAPPRKKRPLRVGTPEIHPVTTADGVELKLTRYRGGDKGPVILSHGLGVSSLIFAIDTIETNLLEFLYAHGYDVWLLDFRASIDLPASQAQATADDVATQDYPAAVAKVREVTGAPSVQMVVHCFGSTTFFMAMLAGLEGVRSAVASQIATDIVAPPLTRLKSGLHLTSALKALGVDSLTAYSDSHADWLNRLYDKALRLYPVDADERCASPVCHRISFLYSLLYEHSQLNPATHDALHEMFGIANIASLDHLSHLVAKGHLVDAGGEEVYMPHLDRLNIPITFIHGAENACFLPESTARTFEALREKNGKELYARHVIPGYGHIDCIFGKDAARDVYPYILQHLEATL